jgi:hypothetical protein
MKIMIFNKTFKFEKYINRHSYLPNLRSAIVLVCLICSSFLYIQGQTKKVVKKSNKAFSCKIGTVSFECPEDFKKEQVVDENTILFKRDYEGSISYFFVAFPKQEFDDAPVRGVIAEKISGKPSDTFRWKDVKEPITMTLETKYEKKIVNRLGYNNKIINFVSRYFEFNGKQIVLGYGYDTNNDGLVKFFERGEAIGDNAIGCNAIATTLNSITKEKKGKLQYCTIQGFTASK